MEATIKRLTAQQRIGVSKYSSTHTWVYRNFGKAESCVECHDGSKRLYHWSNISGEYKRDKSDWRQLCVSCHKKADMTELSLVNLHIISKRPKPKAWRSVKQVNLLGDVVGKYRSLKEASSKTKISVTAINNNLCGRSKTAGGFRWI